MPSTHWGNWTFNADNACLEFPIPNTASMYQIPVEKLTNSPKFLDFLFAVEEKTWASSVDLGDLLRAFADILGRHVAGGGIDNPIDAKAILRRKYGIAFPA